MRANRIAMTLLCIWGVIVFAGGFAIGYPAFVVNGNIFIILGFSVAAALYLLAGYALRCRVWGVRWWGSLLCVASMAILFLAHMLISWAGIALNLTALICIVASWNFDPESGSA